MGRNKIAIQASLRMEPRKCTTPFEELLEQYKNNAKLESTNSDKPLEHLLKHEYKKRAQTKCNRNEQSDRRAICLRNT